MTLSSTEVLFFLFIYFCLGRSFLSLENVYIRSGFSGCGTWAVGARAPVIVAHGLSCSMACGDIPRPGIKPVSPALQGTFITSGPPGKPDIPPLT